MTTNEIVALVISAGSLLIGGVTAWTSVLIKIAKLEERVKMHEEKHADLSIRLDSIMAKIDELREDLHASRKQ